MKQIERVMHRRGYLVLAAYDCFFASDSEIADSKRRGLVSTATSVLWLERVNYG